MENQETKVAENGMELDDSLTNIDWLERLSGQGLVVEKKRRRISKLKAERPPGVPVKRPQHSYSEMIKLALNSAPGRRMALQQIYSWVEQHFPYYKYYANPGWRNSIRHSLSTQEVFVREAGKSGGTSCWMMKPQPPFVLTPAQSSNEVISEIIDEKDRKRKKLQPLLPRGMMSCLVPASVLINPPALFPVALSALPTPHNVQGVMSPKLPIARCFHATHTSAGPKTSSNNPQKVVVKRWNRHAQQRLPRRRKQTHQTLALLQSDLDDSGLGGDKMVLGQSTGSRIDNPSSLTTERRTCLGLTTSTPDKATSLASPDTAGHTPITCPDSFLDVSFSSPEDRSEGDEGLGHTSFTRCDTFSPDARGGEGDLPDFSFFSFTPIREGPGSEAHNESLGPVLGDFPLADFEQGTNLTNLNWLQFT